ncbi:GNAT family N-acetyltransferase [Pseudoalteromonas luteoviolacea]|uniref:N-acetyltransferase domain-containing protein n=1 Tax=Pseudoalteromonas luteoviolacea NCIMB 1942 TaxID=1365253 RepID=A0A166Z4W1_9GAMM|nr:GNAT family N-acetyltransferase [Pseudoalteromonas luteoviolacea]KZN43844.1 hypothetical protein N482_18625 [Pseudoalteromonas luteoviolacea NCIMB 1942]KZX01529.1 hypothetical protein JL49_05305 [Pseudoalteromonas luteoviolacea]
MAISTPRLKLRLLNSNDWLFFKNLNQNQQIMQYVADIEDEQTLFSLFESRVTTRKKGQEGWLSFVIEMADTNELVGLHGIKPVTQNECQAEIGFMLHPDFQGKGFALEATQAVINFAFKNLKYEALHATVTAGNVASAKLLEKLGFIHKKTIESNYQINGKWYDDLILVLEHD